MIDTTFSLSRQGYTLHNDTSPPCLRFHVKREGWHFETHSSKELCTFEVDGPGLFGGLNFHEDKYPLELLVCYGLNLKDRFVASM